MVTGPSYTTDPLMPGSRPRSRSLVTSVVAARLKVAMVASMQTRARARRELLEALRGLLRVEDDDPSAHATALERVALRHALPFGGGEGVGLPHHVALGDVGDLVARRHRGRPGSAAASSAIAASASATDTVPALTGAAKATGVMTPITPSAMNVRTLAATVMAAIMASATWRRSAPRRGACRRMRPSRSATRTSGTRGLRR